MHYALKNRIYAIQNCEIQKYTVHVKKMTKYAK